MKRILSPVLAALILLTIFSSCKKEEVKIVYKDTLVIENTEKTFAGAKSRYNAVINSLVTKVTTLEECHNTSIKNSEPDNYYFNSDYIMATFDPFVFSYFEMTDRFSPEMTAQEAIEVFKNDAGGADIKYSCEDGKMTLQFLEENLIRTWETEYDEQTDSFRYSYAEDNISSETTVEFLEFVPVSEGVYAIMSNTTKCYITFDEDNNIEYFICSQVKDTEFSPEDGIFGTSAANLTAFKNNVDQGKKTDYDQIHEFGSDTLTHLDSVEENLNEVQIYQGQYQSAFVY